MRKVTRPPTAIPDVLAAEKSKGQKESKAAIEYFKRLIEDKFPPNDKPPTFAAYKDRSVSASLNELFFGKCAYCEGRFAGLHPVDIEHWRPKADVYLADGKLRKFGYYWLAAAWENLLPSCIDCNRIRTHMDVVTKTETTLGKGNWFPLSDEASRSQFPGKEVDEDPLLLNPCHDEPSHYLYFLESGCVTPKPGLDEAQRKKAFASIRFYALNRTELVQDRLSRILLIKQKMNTIERLAALLDQNDLDPAIDYVIDGLLAFELQTLYEFQKPDQPFSAMATQLIQPFIEKYRT